MFQVRIIKVDHYMSAPIPELDVTFSDFRKSSIKSVPVIRIFGSTPKGEKTCVHVHGIFPYICVPYDGSEPFPKLAHQLAASLDKAINIASGFSTSNSQHVYKVVLVSGIPFYGYHRHRHQFLKIYFYKPSVIKQAVSLLQNGAILNKLFQPHEAHIPFILQFFIDFNLYGMSFIDFQTVRFRRTKHIESVDVAPEHILPVNIPPVSLSQFEVDALACHISNRPSSQGDGQLSNPGLAAIWEDERKRRLNIDGTPLEIPQLHSQRPVQKSTPSELFFLRRIQGILENSSQSADDSSLSGGTLGPTNKSYAIEEPVNTAAVDASFVSLHVSAEVHSEHPLDNAILDETVVNEDIAVMSQSLISQSLDRSLALEVEDFELLDALETLADAVDNNSVLGSQTARGKSDDVDDSNSEGEDEKWHDKTLVAEEDEAMKLLDLTMPEFDEAAILNNYVNKENQPGPSCASRIPQVDGPSGQHARSTFRIPQLDGMNDVPLKPGRKSLGMRGGSRSRSSNRLENCPDNRYNAQGELIFRFKSSSTSESRAGPSTDTNVGVSQSDPSSNFLTKTQSKKTAAYDIPASSSGRVSPTVQCASYDQQQILLCDGSTINSGLLIGSSTEVAPTDPDLYFPSQPTIQNTLSESAIENVLSQQDLFTQSSIQNTISEQLICLMPQCLEEPLVTQNVAEELAPAFFSEAMELQDQDVGNIQPPVICCSSAAVGCGEDCGDNFDGEDGVNAFLDEIARRVEEPVLRGDPSLYPEPPPEKEESLADLLSAALCKANSGGEDCAEMPVDVVKTDIKEESIGSRVRRSSRHASHDSSSRNIVVPEFPTPDQLAEKDKPSVSVDGMEEAEGNLSPCSCYDLTGFGDTMFNGIHDYGVSTVEWTNFGAGASDSELCRLSGALEKGQMEEILQTGCEETESAVASTTTRRDEVMQHLLETQKTAAEPIKMECQGTCSKAKAKQRSVMLTGTGRGDPVTDELLHRGIMPRAGPPRLGKNMKLAKLFCSTPNFRRTPPVKRSAEHQLKRQRRQQRKSKLSITAQRMKRQCKSSSKRLPPLKPCCVTLERLTKSTIRRVCNKFKVKLKDEVLQFLRKYENPSLSFSRSLDTLNSSGGSTEFTPVLENPSIRASLKCSPLEVTKASILCGGKSRRPYHRRFTNPQLCRASVSTDSNIQDVSVNVTHVSEVQETVHETLNSTASTMHQNDYVSEGTDRCGRSKGKKRGTNRRSLIQSSEVEILPQQQVHEVTVMGNAADNLKDPKSQKPNELLPNEVNTPSKTVDNDEPRNALLLCKNESNLYQVQSVRRRGRKPLPQKGHGSKQEMVNSVDINPRSKKLSSVKELTDSKAADSSSKSTCVNAKTENADVFQSGIFEKETKISPNNLEYSSLLTNQLDSSDKNEKLSPRSNALEKIVKKVITPAKKLSTGTRKRRSSSIQSEKQDNIPKLVPVLSNPQKPTSEGKVVPISTNILSTKENAAKVLKNYKIPKKLDLNREVAPQECNLKGAKEVGGAHCLSAPSTSGIVETCNKTNSKDGSSFYLSLDASGMDLYSSEGNNREKETETPSCAGKFTGDVLSGKSCSPYPQSIGKSDHLKPIMCVDGAQSGSSSDSSSGGQCEDQAGNSNLSKRKWPSMSDEVCSQSGKMGEGSGPSRKRNHEGVASWVVPEIDTSCVPMSVAHWFAKPYAPWSLWSPASSPNAHHHAHLFSPPRAESPEVSNFCGFPTGAGCIEEEEACASNDNKSFPPPQGLICSHSTETTLKSTTVKSKNFEIEAAAKYCSDDTDSSSEKGSHEHSISDFFCDKSFDSDDSNLNKNDIQPIKDITGIHLDASPTSCVESLYRHPASEYSNAANQKEDVLSTSFQSLGRTSSKDGSNNVSWQPNEATELDSMTESNSADLPCGQQLNSLCSWEKVPKSHILSCTFRPLQKPPSRKEVIVSLATLNLPEVLNPEPYFNNPRDVKGKVEVGGRILDLTSKKCVHLEEFSSNISELKGLSIQRRNLFECIWGFNKFKGDFDKLISNHAIEKMVTIIPVKKPPGVQDVKVWAKARQIIRADKDLANKEKTIGESLLRETLQCDEMGLASTPDIRGKKSGDIKVPSPLLTPIPQVNPRLHVKMTKTKSENFLKSLGHIQSPLPSICEREEDDMGVDVLQPITTASSVRPNNSSHGDSLLNHLLSDSQFCQGVDSPTFRHVADASACQVKGINASPGFKMNLENLQTVKTTKEHQYISILTVEVHVCTCGSLNPDPERDPIRAIFYTVCNDVPEHSDIPCQSNGILAVNFSTASPLLKRCGIECAVNYSIDEKSLVLSLVSLVHRWDPDILAGFEIEMQSWGYILQRASVLGVNLIQELSRIPNQKEGKQIDDEDNNGVGGLKVTGRIILDVWRVFRSEVALQSYTFENLMYHVLHERVSHHSFETLSRWWENPSHLHRWMTVRYYQNRVLGVMRLIDQLDIIGRTSELARLFGIQFFEVLSRGSQFRVESMMLRLAKPLNYIPVSPSVQQRAHMRAPECLPLIMEPESRFYKDPLIVLDFQSLYPSMIIAYNYCFSTCLGRVEHLGKSTHFEFGCSELRIKNSHLQELKDCITVSPSGIAFVTKAVRHGILPKMLEEILEARLAVKQSMKHHKDDRTLQRVLHARQLGLKLIANVTYGYTSANFSGRMPCIEVGDSVVSKGRETLERAISLVHSNSEWQARVVYGDTDSLFVLVPGRSRQEAFRIGAEIAAAVTQDNPSPVKLKLEKVYQPSILQTKKRYVGFMYESPDQKQPVYEAKGIETVRRDGCPAVSKMLEKSLRILFETCDVSSVKSYVTHQFSKILAGRANIQDLIYAREFRGKENYRPGACVPALELTKRWLRQDRRAEPRIGERVPYVIVNGPPGSALIHLVRHPNELLSDPSLRYNAVYYVTRAIIPPLARCLSLLGADVAAWYADLPRKSQLLLPRFAHGGFKKTISQYFTTMECACCGDLTHSGVCGKCRSNPQLVVASLMSKLHNWESTHLSVTKVCQSCLKRLEPLDCCSLDCPITYRRHQSAQKQKQSLFVSELLNEFVVTSITSQAED